MHLPSCLRQKPQLHLEIDAHPPPRREDVKTLRRMYLQSGSPLTVPCEDGGPVRHPTQPVLCHPSDRGVSRLSLLSDTFPV